MNGIRVRMLQILTVILAMMMVWQPAKAVPEMQKRVETPETGGIFADSAVVDLGNHRVAYLTESDDLERRFGYEKWIVFQKLGLGDVYGHEQALYIPAEGTITAVGADDFGIDITTKAGGQACKTYIPICFMLDTGFIEMYSMNKMVAVPLEDEKHSDLSGMKWTEGIDAEEKYKLMLEQVSVPYKSAWSEQGGRYADYRLKVSDMQGKILQELILKNLPISYADTYWMIDVNKDGFRDLIFCEDHVEGQENSSTKLRFLIWNNDKKSYEEKPLERRYEDDFSYVGLPVWNAKEGALMFETEKLGNYWARGWVMYRFVDGEWQLYAKLIPSNDEVPPAGMDGYEKEIYYKDLDYYYIEERYESGEMISGTVIEEAPYWDEQSMWYWEGEGNQELFPNSRAWGYLCTEQEFPESRASEYAEQEQEEENKNSDESIYDKNYYDLYDDGKEMYIRFQEENLQKELEDYFDVSDYAEGTEILADMFLDKRTCEMEEEELRELFYRHGYLLHLHHKEVDGLHIRLAEVQEIDGLSVYPVRIAIQTWDKENLYVEDITAPIQRKIRDFLLIEDGDALRMVLHSTGVSADYIMEEELSFWEWQDNGEWVLVPMDLKVDTSHAHRTGGGYPDLDRNTLFPAVYYRDGIAFRASRQGDMQANYTGYRLGKLEEVEKNKSFRLKSIYEILGRTYIWEYGDCYIQFYIA